MASGCYVGALRWDAWYSAASGEPAVQTARTLSHPSHTSRAPIHLIEGTNGRITFDLTTAQLQAALDAECIAAQAGGLSYWAFLMYGSASTGYIRPDLNTGMMAGLKYYRTSAENTRIKWCLMQQADLMGTTGNYAAAVTEMVGWMLESNYQRVLTNRPLMYIYGLTTGIATRWAGNNANFKVMLDAVRAGVIAGGAGDPYIVGMEGTDTTIATAIGCDAISNYISTIPAGPAAYTALDTSARAYWATLLATGKKVVPIVMCGWNPAPRQDRPQTWNAASADYRPHIGTNTHITLPTTTELATHFQAAVDYVNAHPTECNSKAIIAYAWNEHDEGGWLGKTVGDPTGARLTAIQPVIAF